MSEEGRKPKAKITSTSAWGLSVAIWGSNTEGVYNVTWQKRYKDKETNEYKNSTSLTAQDCLGLAHLLQQAVVKIDKLKEENTNPFD